MIIETTIKAAVKDAFVSVMEQGGDDREGALDKVAGKIAAAVADAIKSATITYSTGLVAPPMGGPVTGVFTCAIS